MKSFIFIFSLCVYFHSAYAQRCLFRLTGHVHSTRGHENLANATIFIQELSRTIITDQNGNFRFDSLCQGTYTIHITHVSYYSTIRLVELVRNLHIDIDMPLVNSTLSEVSITGTLHPSTTGIKKEMTERELQETKGLSLAESLGKITGVTMLQSGSNVSKPVIHGLHGNRILIINNGVRQEGQQWGNEHAPEIDPFIAGKLVVIKGVDELRYGSDAIGGVILIEPKPLRDHPGTNGEINAGWFSNNRLWVFSGNLQHQFKKFPALSFRLQGTYKKGANAKAPDYRMNNTGLEEKNMSATIEWQKEHVNTELFYSFFSTKIGIFTGAHIGNITDLQKAILSDRPDDVFTDENTYEIERPYQYVTHHLVKSKTNLQAGAHKFSALISAQFNTRREYDIVRNSSVTKPQIDLSIYTFSQELNWEHPRKNNFRGVAGISAVQQDNLYSGRYFIPNYLAYTFGGFYIEKWSKEKWDVEAGIRYDNKSIHTNRMFATGVEFDEYHFRFSTFASSLNTGYRITPAWKMNANVSLSGRAPHVNELLSNGIHHGTATYEEGNIFLKPERSFNIVFNQTYSDESRSISFDMSVYRNQIDNFIYREPVPDHPVLTIAGAFPRIIYTQTNALLHGIDLSASVKLFKNMEWSAQYSMLRGKDVQKNDWLIFMPADRLENEITFYLSDRKKRSNTYFSIELLTVGRQRRVPDERNGKQDYKPPPDAYTLLNMNLAATVRLLTTPLTINIGIRNLLNTTYRDYLNSMRYFTDETGRNVGIRIIIPFGNIKNG